MTLKERINHWLNSEAPSPNGIERNGRVAYPNKGGYLKNIQQGYDANPIVASCVALYCSTMNEAPLVVGNDDGTVNLNHPISIKWRTPNKRMGQAEFWSIVWFYIQVSGNCYLRKMRGGLGQTEELYPYSDALVVPLLDELGWVYAYRFSSGNYVEDWPERDVIHLKHPMYRDPYQAHMGQSPINVAWEKILTYNELTATIYSLAASNGVPSGALVAPGSIDPTQVSSLKQQLATRRDSAGKKRTDPLVLGAGMQYVQMGLDSQKMQATELFKSLETDICGCFGVHPSVLGTNSGLAISTYNNLESAQKDFTVIRRMPFWNSLEEQIEAGMRDEWKGIQLQFDTTHVAALAADPDSIIYPVIAKFNANLVTQNEARARMGDNELADGDKFAFQVVPAAPSFGAFADDGEDLITSIATEGDGVKRVKWNEKVASVQWKKQDDLYESLIRDMLPHVQATVNEFRVAVLGSDSKRVKKANADVNIQQLLQSFMNATHGQRKKLMEQILALASQNASLDLAEVQSYMDDIADRVARETSAKMKDALETTKNRVSEIIEANAGNESAIIKALKEKFDDMSTGKAETIARTTVKAQSSAAQNEAFTNVNKRTDDPKKKVYNVWLSQRDNRVRPAHEKLDGTYVLAGEAFNEGTGSGPGLGEDPSQSINCRCVLVPTRGARLGL